MIAYLIKSGLCLVILLGIYLLFLEREKMHRFNRFFLLFALMLGLTVPFINFQFFPDPETTSTETQYAAKLARNSAKAVSVVTATYSDFIEDVIEPEIEEPNQKATKKIDPLVSSKEILSTNHQGESNEVAEPAGEKLINGSELKGEKLSNIESRTSKSTTGLAISLKNVIIGLNVIVTLFLLIRLIYGVLGFYQKRKCNQLIEYGSAKVSLLDVPTVPHTFLNTIYVNKAQFESGELSKEILDHELTHARQKHSWDVLFIELLRIVFWFNPIFYFYKRAIQINHEFLADDSVITKTQDSVSYQKLLLDSIFPTYQTNLASTFNYSLTKKRFKMMVKEYSLLSATTRKALLIPVLTCIIFMFCTDIGTKKKIYEINGVEYVPAYFNDGHEANELVLIEYEDKKNSWNPGVYKHYDRDGNLFTGNLRLFDKESGRLQSEFEIKDGKLLLRVEYIGRPTGRYSLMRTIYDDDWESVGMYSPENKLTGSISRINGSKLSIISITNLDSLGSWSDLYSVEEAKDSTALDSVLFSTYTKDGFIKSTKLVSRDNEDIPIEQRHIELITNEAREKYERALIEYKRTLSNNDEDQLWYAYEELKLDRSRWVAFRRELYQNYKKEIAPPVPPMPGYPNNSKVDSGINYKTPLHKRYAELSDEFDKKEAIFLETKTDTNLIEYSNLYHKRLSLYRNIKEIDSTIKPPRPLLPIKKEQYNRVKNNIEDKKQIYNSSEKANGDSPFLDDYLSRLSKYDNVLKSYNGGDKTARDVLYERVRVIYFHERLTPNEQLAYGVPNLDPSIMDKITLNEQETKYHAMLSDYLELRGTYSERPDDKNDVLYKEFSELKKIYDDLNFYSRIFIVDNLPPGSGKYFMDIEQEKGIINEFERLRSASFSELPDTLTIHYVNELGNVVTKRNSELTSPEIDYLKNNAKKSNVTQVYPLPVERKPTDDEIKKWQDDYYYQTWFDGEIIQNEQLLEMDLDKIHHFRIHKIRWNGNRRVPYDYQVLIYSYNAFNEMVEKYRPNKSMMALHDAILID